MQVPRARCCTLPPHRQAQLPRAVGHEALSFGSRAARQVALGPLLPSHGARGRRSRGPTMTGMQWAKVHRSWLHSHPTLLIIIFCVVRVFIR